MYKTSVTDEHAYQSNLKRSAKGENLPDSFPLNVAFSRISTSHLGEEKGVRRLISQFMAVMQIQKWELFSSPIGI